MCYKNDEREHSYEQNRTLKPRIKHIIINLNI